MTRRSQTLQILSGWLGIVVLMELVLLRTGTRTLIHIPGLGRFDTSIGVLSEVGRFAYYLAVVLLISTLIYLGRLLWVADNPIARITSLLVWSFLVVALAGRVGLISAAAVGWSSLVVFTAVAAATWAGIRSMPVGLFVAASAMAAWSVLGQGVGGGLSGQSVDVAVVGAEALVILAGVTAPLLVSGRLTTPALVAGLAAFLIVAAGFSFGGSTLAILTLWNLGVPGWFSPIAFGLAFGGLVTAIWSAIADREVLTAVAIVLLVAGGVGTINTYQTAMVLAAMLLLGVARGRLGPVGSEDSGALSGDRSDVSVSGEDTRRPVPMT
jgi:hypothetical protein